MSAASEIEVDESASLQSQVVQILERFPLGLTSTDLHRHLKNVDDVQRISQALFSLRGGGHVVRMSGDSRVHRLVKFVHTHPEPAPAAIEASGHPWRVEPAVKRRRRREPEHAVRPPADEGASTPTAAAPPEQAPPARPVFAGIYSRPAVAAPDLSLAEWCAIYECLTALPPVGGPGSAVKISDIVRPLVSMVQALRAVPRP